MILVELLLENYKQYAGELQVEFPPQGVVGVIGANGVGKTTLFEAIEWCLYQPRQIPAAEVAPRGGTARTRVRLTLEDPRDGDRYVVERTLRREQANAEVYREAEPGARLTHGSRQVTEYVTRRLIGLGHDAFVSTFFTRQKELSFFGHLKATDRRREVGRLLGLETIRRAQESIREERNRARHDATFLAAQHAQESSDRDFEAELGDAGARIEVARAAAEAAAARLAAATAAHTTARAALERCRDLERRDNELAQTLARLTGDERAAGARRGAAVEALRRLDDAAGARAGLLPLAAREPERAAALRAMEEERRRAERQRQLGLDLERANEASTETAREIRERVASVDPDPRDVPNWAWTARDDADPTTAAERRVALVAGLDVDTACEQAGRLAECRRRAEERDAAQTKADRYAARLGALHAERAELVVEGEPQDVGEAARVAREKDLQRAKVAETEAKRAAGDRRRLEPIAAGLRAHHFDDECPTCGRAFTAPEADVVVATLTARIGDLRAEEGRLQAEQAAAVASADAHAKVQQASVGRVRDLAILDGRIGEGTPKVREAEAEAEAAARACAEALARTGLDAAPPPERVAEAEARANLLQRVARLVPLLGRLAQDARRASEEGNRAHAALAELGPVTYDPTAHAAADRALADARDAAARAAQIADELARRPEHEAALAAAATELRELATERERLDTERAAVGFDPAALLAADAHEQATLDAERSSARARDAAQNALSDATRLRDEVARDQRHVALLAARADARRRDADELNRMDEGFTDFDKYVAARVAPALADHTGELLAAMTDGKYDRVEFDENYGLRIYDGDEKFPVEAFSGGERDVAALAARLALSRLVGGQAAHPPGFLVLDEVFGSLDQERRAHTLETLGVLANNSDAFRQLFIISHVDDVRLSPVFDQVWRVAEVGGVSRVENVSREGTVEEL